MVNTVQNGSSPGLDLGNLILRERSGEPRGRETDIALIDMDMVLEVPRERYAVVVGTGALVLGGGERVGDLCEQGRNGELVLCGHDGCRRRRRDMGVLVVLWRRRRALVTTQKPERHHQRKTIKYTFSAIPLYFPRILIPQLWQHLPSLQPSTPHYPTTPSRQNMSTDSSVYIDRMEY